MPAPPTDPRHALVLSSGGQDATAGLARALRRDARVETIGFDDGQRHRIALDCRLGGRGALAAQVPRRAARRDDDPPPDLRLPGRNLRFFHVAAAVAHRRGASVLVGGMCEPDAAGCPDGRDTACKAVQVAPSLGLDAPMVLETPLVWLRKAQTAGAAAP